MKLITGKLSSSSPMVSTVLMAEMQTYDQLWPRKDMQAWVSSAHYCRPTQGDINDYLNEEFALACEAIKEANTQLIVIRLEIDDADSQTLLSECASSPADFFDVPDASQLDEVFTQLAARMTLARLTQ